MNGGESMSDLCSARTCLTPFDSAPVHSIAAALFLPASRLHQFDDIGES